MSYAAQTARNFATMAAFQARPSEPDELDAMGTICTFARNETLFDEGDEMSVSYKVVSGVVRLCRVTADGRRQIAGFRLPGDLIGVEWAGEYELTAEAVRDEVGFVSSPAAVEESSGESDENEPATVAVQPIPQFART